MTYIEIIDFITFYGVDVAVLGILTSALTQILKTTFLKNAPNKLYAFLPVIIGTVLYAAYAFISHGFCVDNFAYVLEKGFSVGAAATVIYVVYEQFSCGKLKLPTTVQVVEVMIASCIEVEKLNSVAQKIEDEFDSSDLQSAAEKITVTLCENSQGETDKESFAAISLLIAQTLARIKKVTP